MDMWVVPRLRKLHDVSLLAAHGGLYGARYFTQQPAKLYSLWFLQSGDTLDVSSSDDNQPTEK